jgi:hypothetical protein
LNPWLCHSRNFKIHWFWYAFAGYGIPSQCSFALSM